MPSCPHGDAVVDGDGVEFRGETAERFDPLLDVLSDLVQVHVSRNQLGERVGDADDRTAELLFAQPLARHRLLAPAMRRPVVVTALLSGCFIFFLFSAYCAFAICPDNKKPFSSGRKAFLSSFGYTHHLSPVILPKTTSSRLMTLLFEWFWAFMSGISVFVPFQR